MNKNQSKNVVKTQKRGGYDRYAKINLAYSIVWILAAIYVAVFFILPLVITDVSSIDYFLAFYILLWTFVAIVILFFLLNLGFAIPEIITASHNHETAGIVLYVFGFFIPFMGMGYQISMGKKD